MFCLCGQSQRERANIEVTLTLTSEHKCWDRLQPLRQAKLEKQLRRRKEGRMDYIHKRKTVATLLKSSFVPVIKKGNWNWKMDQIIKYPGTFGKEAVSDWDPVGGVWGSGGTACLSSVFFLQLTGQREHGYADVIWLSKPRCTVLQCTAAQMPANNTEHTE